MTNERLKPKGEAYICSICLNNIRVGDDVVFIKYMAFHPKCLKEHIKRETRKVKKEEEF